MSPPRKRPLRPFLFTIEARIIPGFYYWYGTVGRPLIPLRSGGFA